MDGILSQLIKSAPDYPVVVFTDCKSDDSVALWCLWALHLHKIVRLTKVVVPSNRPDPAFDPVKVIRRFEWVVGWGSDVTIVFSESQEQDTLLVEQAYTALAKHGFGYVFALGSLRPFLEVFQRSPGVMASTMSICARSVTLYSDLNDWEGTTLAADLARMFQTTPWIVAQAATTVREHTLTAQGKWPLVQSVLESKRALRELTHSINEWNTAQMGQLVAALRALTNQTTEAETRLFGQYTRALNALCKEPMQFMAIEPLTVMAFMIWQDENLIGQYLPLAVVKDLGAPGAGAFDFVAPQPDGAVRVLYTKDADSTVLAFDSIISRLLLSTLL